MQAWLVIATAAAVTYGRLPTWAHNPIRAGALVIFLLVLALICFLYTDYKRAASAANELALELVDAES
jgi:hypothetical protein